MFKIMSLIEAVAEFRRKAPGLVAVSDHKALKKLFSSRLAAAQMHPEEDPATVQATMEHELREAFLAPGRRIKRGWFDDI